MLQPCCWGQYFHGTPMVVPPCTSLLSSKIILESRTLKGVGELGRSSLDTSSQVMTMKCVTYDVCWCHKYNSLSDLNPLVYST